MKLWFGNVASAAGVSVKNMTSLDASNIRQIYSPIVH
jgi:hypothetical protein